MNSFIKICRACLKETILYSSILDNPLVQEMFFRITGIKAFQNDGLSTKICSECSESLIKAIKFQDLCIESDRIAKENLQTDDLNGDSELERTIHSFDVPLDVPIVIAESEDEKDQIDVCDLIEWSDQNQDCNMESSATAKVTANATTDVSANDQSERETEECNVTVLCDISGEGFTRNTTLLSHIQVMDTNNANPDEVEKDHVSTNQKLESTFKCKKCGKTFKTENDVLQHLKEHTAESHGSQEKEILKPQRIRRKKPYCEQCDKYFTRAYSLNRHQLKHDEELKRNFYCKHCDKPFSNLFNLKRHELAHTEELNDDQRNAKPNCKHCDKYFSNTSSLKRHESTHTEELNAKPYCELCDKYFSNTFSLKRHESTHTEELNAKAYCELCDKYFSSTFGLKRHQLKHTEELNCDQRNAKPHYEHCDKHIPGMRSLRSSPRPSSKCNIEILKHTEELNGHQRKNKRKSKLTRHHYCEHCGKYFTRLFTLKRHQIKICVTTVK